MLKKRTAAIVISIVFILSVVIILLIRFTFKNNVSTDLNEQYAGLLEYWNGEYPDYFGGTYIDDNELYVLITSDSEKIKKEIRKGLKTQKVKFVVCQYSYQELEAVQNTIVTQWQSEPESGAAESIIGVGIDVINNCVLIEILGNKDRIEEFLEETGMVDEKMVNIIIKDEKYEEK